MEETADDRHCARRIAVILPSGHKREGSALFAVDHGSGSNLAGTGAGCSLLLSARHALPAFFELRARLWSSQMKGTPEWFQSGTAVLITFEFLLYPVSVLLLYFLVEGFVRFAAGLLTSEVVPTLPVWLGFKLIQLEHRRKEARRLSLTPPDRFEVLPEERLRISSGLPKAGWNGSISISIDDRWYEIESESSGGAPYPCIYVLRPAPPGKILRRLERYERPRPGTQEGRNVLS